MKKYIPDALKRPFRRLYYDYLNGYAQESYSQEGEDMVLRRLFEHKSSGFYVDIGAHHPKRFSNTYFFYRRGWHGINVEPNPHGYALLRSLRKRDINLQLAISDVEHVQEYFVFDEPALNTFDQKLANQYASKHQLLEVRKIPLTTLRKILDQSKSTDEEIDFMSIDVEGLDLQVLMSNDWSRYRPKVIVAESLGINLEQVLQSDTKSFMEKHAYEPFAKTVNSVFYRDTTSPL